MKYLEWFNLIVPIVIASLAAWRSEWGLCATALAAVCGWSLAILRRPREGVTRA